MKTKFLLISLLCIIAILYSCEKKENVGPNDVLRFYKVSSYETIDNYGAIDETSVVVSDTIYIDYEEIKSYNQHDFRFRLTDTGKDNFVNRIDTYGENGVFAAVINDEVIYAGYFVPPYISSSWGWVTIDPTFTGNSFDVNLGYPWEFEEFSITDNRNEQRLLDVLNRDGKLKN